MASSGISSLMRVSCLTLCGALLLCSCISVTPPPTTTVDPLQQAPVAYAERIQEKLALAGDNSAQVVQYLASAPEHERWAAWFMAANVPPHDLGLITAGYLLENQRLAFQARRDFPWGKDVSDELFLHYVLPYHLSQEPMQPWRQTLYSELKQRVKGITDIAEAALELNRWAAEKIKFKETEFRDQGPLTSIKRGIGRCEEMMILYIAAARTIGIPARPCSTPWWPFCDNNHAWVEVWAHGAWHFLGSAEPRPVLDDAWFGKAAHRAAAVRSVAFGMVDKELSKEPIYLTGEDFSIINSTAIYTSPCEIAVTVLRDGQPATETAVYLSVFNFGAFRAIARAKTDSSGNAGFIVGPGEMLVTAGDDDVKSMTVVNAAPDQPARLTLALEPDAVLPNALWLHYPPPLP